MNEYTKNIGLSDHLQALAMALLPGMHLITERRGYVHHGIYAGNGEVVHYVGFKRFLRSGPVEKTSLADFSGGFGFRVQTTSQARYLGAEVVRRAASRLGEDDYRLLTNNCEHFCTWCLFGESRSDQVQALLMHPWRALLAIFGILYDLRAGRADQRNPDRRAGSHFEQLVA